MKKLIIATAIMLTASAAVAQTAIDPIDKAVSATNTTQLALYVNKTNLTYASALQKMEEAGWPVREQFRMTLQVNSRNHTNAQLAQILSKPDLASIDDPFYMAEICSIFRMRDFWKSQEGSALYSRLRETRPAWATVACGQADIDKQTLNAAVEAYGTDRCSGLNNLYISRQLINFGMDASGIYDPKAWYKFNRNFLSWFSLPSMKGGEQSAKIISDWMAACWTTGKYDIQAMFRGAKTIDKIRGNKDASIDLLEKCLAKDSIDENFLFEIALYIGNNDKIIDIVTDTKGGLSPKNIEEFIKIVVGADIDYKKAEILKALKTVNQRYTLKLYDDRDKWEPVLSKIRALIDTKS